MPTQREAERALLPPPPLLCVQPVVVEKLPWETVVELQNQKYAHAKHVYYITPSSMAKLRGCEQDMCRQAACAGGGRAQGTAPCTHPCKLLPPPRLPPV